MKDGKEIANKFNKYLSNIIKKLNMKKDTGTSFESHTANQKFSRRQIFSLRLSKWDTYYSLWEKNRNHTKCFLFWENHVSLRTYLIEL